MSQHHSSTNVHILLKAFKKLIRTLEKNYLQIFQRLLKDFKIFSRVAEKVSSLIVELGLPHEHDLNKAQVSSGQVLSTFFNNMKDIKIRRNSKPDKKALARAISKRKWSQDVSLLQKLHSNLLSQVSELERLMEGEKRLNKKYYAILVTTPPVHMYGYLSDKLCAPPDRPAVINWNYKGRNNIPSMVASLAFRRHFALCLVRKEVWESTNKTLAQKFENQLFWDYYGQSTQYSRASCWSLRNIITINAIQELGIVKSDKDATQKCTEYYCKLQQEWDYRFIWWNSADFALSLATLMVDHAAAQTCCEIMCQLNRLRSNEITEARIKECEKNKTAGLVACFGSLCALAVTAGAAAPIAGAAAVGSGALSLGSKVAGDTLKESDAERERWRVTAYRRLQERFPCLALLFGG